MPPSLVVNYALYAGELMSPEDELLQWHGLRLDLLDKRNAARAAGDVARAKIYEGALTEVDAEIAKHRKGMN